MSSAPISHSEAPSATATIVNDDQNSGYNEEVEHELYPGPEERKKDPYLVEFDPDDKMNPKVYFSAFPSHTAYTTLTTLCRTGLVYIGGT